MFGVLKHTGEKPLLELLNEQNFEKSIFTKLKGVIFEFFFNKFFTPNFKEKPIKKIIEISNQAKLNKKAKNSKSE